MNIKVIFLWNYTLYNFLEIINANYASESQLCSVYEISVLFLAICFEVEISKKV